MISRICQWISGITNADMNNISALKPDKTAVLHDTVLQVNAAMMGQGLCSVQLILLI